MCPETISKKCDLPVSLYPLAVTLKRDQGSIVANVDRLFAYSNEKEKIMAEVMTAQATLEKGMHFDAVSGSGYHVTLDADEHGGGENKGFRPMELLLVGLAGCTGMDVISILRKKRQDVTGYQVHVQGVRAEEHPM